MTYQGNNVYIVSGPAGVGKSTTSKALVTSFQRSAYLSGDYISHMHIKGRQKPWESKEELSLIWNNILCLTQNFLKNGNDVVIDYVTFPEEAKWLRDQLKDLQVEVIYAVLWARDEILLERDRMRKKEHHMGERCLILAQEFKESGLDEKHLIDTSLCTVQDIPKLIDDIKNDPKYIVEQN